MNDSSGNKNITYSYFNAWDPENPYVQILSPLGSAHNISNNPLIQANVSDNYNVSSVIANIMFPEAGISTLDTMLPIIIISCPDKASKTGAAIIAAKVIKMT